jgi:hypothetical protein
VSAEAVIGLAGVLTERLGKDCSENKTDRLKLCWREFIVALPLKPPAMIALTESFKYATRYFSGTYRTLEALRFIGV